MLRIKRLNSSLGKKVYTDVGDYFGEVEEVILSENKIDSWRIRVAREMVAQLNGARGVIIPHQFVKAVGDIIVVNRASLPISEESASAGTAKQIPDEETMDLSEGAVNLEAE